MEVVKDICKVGIKEKFDQNNNLKLLLLSTNNQTLVEASSDKVWGTGVSLKDEHCLNKDHWNGIGILGEILMELRSTYQNSDTDISCQNNDASLTDSAMMNQNITGSTDMTSQNTA